MYCLFVCLFPSSEALRLVVGAAKPGLSVLSLCEMGDAYIMTETGKVFKKEKEMKKGKRRWMCGKTNGFFSAKLY